MRPSRSITIKDSIIIGNRTPENSEDEAATEFKSDMEEADQGLELLRKLKSIKREDVAGYRQIELEAKMTEAQIEIMKMETANVSKKREGELVAFDLAMTLNELRDQCLNCEAFAVKVTIEVLKEKVNDERSLNYIEDVGRLLDAVYYDPFRKLESTHKTRILELCNYIEEAYKASLVHWKDKK